MSILSKDDIINEIKNNNIIMSPYNENFIQPNSIDVSIGDYIYRQKDLKLDVYNMFKEDSVKNFWIKSHSQYKNEAIDKIIEYYDKFLLKNLKENEYIYKKSLLVQNLVKSMSNIKNNDKLIVLYPQERILGHTNEFIGSKDKFTTMMKSRSSTNRNGITICDCAGLGDVGYINRWTMEITNNLSVPTFLKVGEKVGQIIFFPVNNINNNYYKGRYQNSNNIDEIIKDWTPDHMLPKSYL